MLLPSPITWAAPQPHHQVIPLARPSLASGIMVPPVFWCFGCQFYQNISSKHGVVRSQDPEHWTSDFAQVQTANSTGSYGSLWEKTSPQFRWFLRWRFSHKKWLHLGGIPTIFTQFITRKMWFCQPKIGLLYYIDEVCVSSLQSHIMATPFDILMLAPDASMALSIGGGAGSWRANSSPKAPGKTYVTNQSKHQPPNVESKAPKVKNMPKKLRLGKFYSRPYSLIGSTGSIIKKSNTRSVFVPSWGALRIACQHSAGIWLWMAITLWSTFT